MTGHFTAEAIVLNAIDYGESDRIVTIYTREFGKVKGIAKGAKRSRKRFVNNLEPFSHIRVLFSQKRGRDLAIIEQADIIGRFDNLTLNIERLASGSCCLELINEMTPEGQRNQKAFELLLKFLAILEGGANPERIMRIFEMRLLSILGYHPYLDGCVVCKNVLADGNKLFFSSSKSGILCFNCSRREKSLIPVSLGAIKFLMLAARTDIDKVDRIAMADWAAEECEKILGDFIKYQLGKELKSRRFMEKISCKI